MDIGFFISYKKIYSKWVNFCRCYGYILFFFILNSEKEWSN